MSSRSPSPSGSTPLFVWRNRIRVRLPIDREREQSPRTERPWPALELGLLREERREAGLHADHDLLDLGAFRDVERVAGHLRDEGAEDLLAFDFVESEHVRGPEVDEEVHDPIDAAIGVRKCSTFQDARLYAFAMGGLSQGSRRCRYRTSDLRPQATRLAAMDDAPGDARAGSGAGPLVGQAAWRVGVNIRQSRE